MEKTNRENQILVKTEQLDTAVLFLVFNRPNTTRKAFEAIRQAKPKRLYVGGDGAREGLKGEKQLVLEARKIATSVDWECDVKTLFSGKNLGCKGAVSSAITWFFEQEEMGIILEDDCVAHPDFFTFCDTLLNHYKNEECIIGITGDNFQKGHWRGDGTYYFSKYNHIWGWATWRRAWHHFDGDLKFWPWWKLSQDWRKKMPDRVERRYWRKIFDRIYTNTIDSWAYPWTACAWYSGGLTATPNVNLVSNIGFGQDATHTVNAHSPEAGLPVFPIGEIVHPKSITCHFDADKFVFNEKFGGKHLRFPYSLKTLLYKAASLLFRYMKIAQPE